MMGHLALDIISEPLAPFGKNIRSGVFICAQASQHPCSLMVQLPRTAKISQNDAAAARQACHEDIFRLEIAVDNVSVMQEVEGEKNLSYNDRSFDIGECPILMLNI
jgi:hypothetical protein